MIEIALFNTLNMPLWIGGGSGGGGGGRGSELRCSRGTFFNYNKIEGAIQIDVVAVKTERLD